MASSGTADGGGGGGLVDSLAAHPPQPFERGALLIESILLETADLGPATSPPPTPTSGEPRALVGYVVEGLVGGMWSGSRIAPENRGTAIVAGDGRWIGADAFKFGKNLFQYTALAPTTASVFPLAWLREEGPRPLLLDFLRSVSLDWCTAASVLSLGANTLSRRALLLLYDMSRLHPRPELEVRQKDIADMLGVARQTLQPVLKKFEERGLISLGYAEIVIADPRALIDRLRKKS
jgi:CRP-like cAMP-binding protein